MASSTDPSQENVLKREHSDNLLDSNKRTRRTLPQVPEVNKERGLMSNAMAEEDLMEALDTTTRIDLTQNDLAYILYISGVRYGKPHKKWNVNSNNEGELEKLYEDASRATGGDGVLEDALRQAWSSKDFSEIRNAEFFREPPPPAETVESTSSSVDNTLIRKVVSQAWKAPYQSDCDRYLYDTIQDVKSFKNLETKNKTTPSHEYSNIEYSNTMSIVQSSGSGKSRLVDQLASRIFTIPMNLRNPKESDGQAFPDPDPEVTNFLTVRGDEMNVRIRFQAFFESLFEATYKWVDTHRDSQISATLTTSWKTYMDDRTQRDTFYSGVISNAGEKLVKSSIALKSAVEGRQVPDALKKLYSLLPDGDKIKVVMYFDEAHELCKQEVHKAPKVKMQVTKNNYEIMLSVLNVYVDEPLFALFLSTASSLSLLAPPPKYAVSARALGGYHQAPFTEMPFDCAPHFFVNYDDTLTLQEVNKPMFLSNFGRPLYWTFMKELDSNKTNGGVISLLKTLRMKLLSDKDLISFTPKELGALAVADVRLCLQYEPHVEAYGGKTVELVASHMRTAFSVPFHREYLRSGYPSEPMLAEAAAQQTDVWRGNDNPFPLINVLQHYLNNGLLDRGERGEVISRALITEAYDRAVKAKGDKEAENIKKVKDDVCPYSGGCSLLDFMCQLFSPDVYAMILESEPANMPKGTGETFAEMFKNAWVRFTHFAKGVDDHLLTQHAMAAAFIRCMAWICRNGEKAVDIIIPVFMGGSIKPEAMTAVLIQVKRRTKSGQYVIDAEKTFKFFTAPDNGEKMAYITLVMDLGVQQFVQSQSQRPAVDAIRKLKEPLAKGKKAAHNSGTPTHKDGIRLPLQPERRTSRNYREPHPRYSINITGCTDKVYAVISDKDNNKFIDLLRLQQFLFEHPREKGLKYVEKQKPYFAAGEQSYHWLACELLNPSSVSETPGEVPEGILVGEEADGEDEFDEYEDEE